MSLRQRTIDAVETAFAELIGERWKRIAGNAITEPEALNEFPKALDNLMACRESALATINKKIPE